MEGKKPGGGQCESTRLTKVDGKTRRGLAGPSSQKKGIAGAGEARTGYSVERKGSKRGRQNVESAEGRRTQAGEFRGLCFEGGLLESIVVRISKKKNCGRWKKMKNSKGKWEGGVQKGWLQWGRGAGGQGEKKKGAGGTTLTRLRGEKRS